MLFSHPAFFISASDDNILKNAKMKEKNYGLLKWLTVGNFEEKLTQVYQNMLTFRFALY